MEELLYSNSGRGHGQISALFRSHSKALSVNSDMPSDDFSDGSDSTQCCISTRKIALAKKILEEATHSYTPTTSVAVAKSAKNTGALGPLLAMLQCDQQDNDKLRLGLDTLAFLLLDKANRKMVNELNGLDVILSIFQKVSDTSACISALDALVSLVKHDDVDKERLWRHQGKNNILALIHAKQLPCYLAEILCLLRKIAFRGNANAVELLEPGLLTSVSQLLHPNMDTMVLHKALRLLRVAAESSGHEHLAAWYTCVFKLTPLLKEPAVCEATVNVMLSLSEHMAFKNIFYAAGAVPPLLGLLTHHSKAISTTAACIVSCLSEGGLCRQQLCQDPAITALLKILPASSQTEVLIGVLYTLSQLASFQRTVLLSLRQRGAVQLLAKLLQRWTDEDLVMGAVQLLEKLEASNSSSATSNTLQSPVAKSSAMHRVNSKSMLAAAGYATDASVLVENMCA